MDEGLKTQIRQRMEERDTEALLAIWTRSDGEVWSDEAYALARETLVARGVEPPEPPTAAEIAARTDPADDGLDDETYHDPNRLLDMASWSARLSWLFLAACVIAGILIVVTLLGALVPNPNTYLVALSLITGVWLALLTAFLFILGQAVAQGLYILVDIYDSVNPLPEANA